MIETIIKGIALKFETSAKVFSPTAIDLGTLAMLAQVTFSLRDKVLDLGCGYGVVGILAAKIIGSGNVIMCDISPDAVIVAKRNAAVNGCEDLSILPSDGLDGIADDDFSLILSNPPYHVDFAVPKRFIEDSFKKLRLGGRLYMVTKRKDWYKNKMIAVFGGVQIVESDGYFVFCAEKRPAVPQKKAQPDKSSSLPKKIQRRQERQKRPKA